MTDVFNSQQVMTPEVTVDPVADLVGEGKKFKDVAALAKGKQEADTYIETLKRENAQLRTEANRVTDLEAQMEQLRTDLKSSTNDQRKEPNPQLDDADLKNLIVNTITETEKNRAKLHNVTIANNELIKHAGSLEKAQAIVAAKAQELGVSKEMLRDVAMQSPTAFTKLLLGDTAPVVTGAPSVQGTVNSEATKLANNSQVKVGTKEFYDAKFKDPKTGQYTKHYWDPKVQNEIIDNANKGIYIPT